MITKLESARIFKEDASMFALPLPTPPGISGDSSIAPAPRPAEGVWAAIARPFAPPPQEPIYMLELLRIEQKMSTTLEKEGKNLELDIRADLKRLEQFNREKIAMLRSDFEALKAQEKWGAWKAAAEYLAYSSSIALSLVCAGTGNIAPALFLFSSGAIGIINRIGSDSGAWRWAVSFLTENHQHQVHYAQLADTALTTTAVALSFLGAYNAYHAELYEKLAELGLGTISTTFGIAVNGAQVGQRLGEGYYENRRMKIQAELKQYQEKTTTLHAEVTMNTAEIQKMFKLSEEIDKVIKIAIASQQQR